MMTDLINVIYAEHPSRHLVISLNMELYTAMTGHLNVTSVTSATS